MSSIHAATPQFRTAVDQLASTSRSQDRVKKAYRENVEPYL